MTKYNLYRISHDQLDAMVEKLQSVGLSKVGEQDSNEYRLSFFFSKTPDPVSIWWADEYFEFLQSEPTPKNQVFFGVLVVSKGEVCYAVSLGKSHFYLKSFCDLDFGLNLAERIVDSDNLKIKNSKFYKSKKSKTITTYHDGSEVDFDSGESMHYLKAKTVDPTKWGTVASFGNSVLLNIPLTPRDLPELIEQIEEELKKPAINNLPRVEQVKDEEVIAELDRKLANAILASEAGSDVDIDEFTVSGVNFVFSDAFSYSLYVKGQSANKAPCEELSVRKLVSFVRQLGINLQDTIDDIRVTVHRETGRDFSSPLSRFSISLMTKSDIAY